MAIREYFVNSGTSQFVSLNLDDEKYVATLRTILGIESTIPVGASKYPYRSIREALGTAKITRLRARCKSTAGNKRRIVSFVCDADKADSAASELIGKTVKVGLGAGIPYEITRVTSG